MLDFNIFFQVQVKYVEFFFESNHWIERWQILMVLQPHIVGFLD